MQKHMRQLGVVLIVAAVIIAGVSVWGSLAFAGPKKVKPISPVPKTGQTVCGGPIITPGGIDCAGTGQDGEIQAGVALPTPRFRDNGNGTVTDYLTGLIWLKDVGCMGHPAWPAFTRVTELNSGTDLSCADYVPGTFSDWRIPNINELHSLISRYGFIDPPAISNTQGNAQWSEGDPFVNVPTIIENPGGRNCLMSSTPWTEVAQHDNPIWCVDARGFVIIGSGSAGSGFYWPVRGPE